jgi:hypothetical protein
MSGKVRMLPVKGSATGWAGSPSNAQGRRSYSASAGQFVDLPELDADAIKSSGFFAVGGVGPTLDRPNNRYLTPGFLYVDTDLSLVIAWDGADWRNPITGAVA